MAFNTPTYDYGLATNKLSTNKGLADQAQTFGRFLSQERHRRGLADTNRTFQDRFPRVGQGFQNRGLYHSGLRREGQRKEAESFQRGVGQQNFEFGVGEAAAEQAQTFRDAQYQQALLDLFDQMQRARAGQDPFASLNGVIR